MDQMTLEEIQQLPKAELHVHLDGSIRPETLLDLAKKQNIDLPFSDVPSLRKYLQVGKVVTDLEAYIKRFDITLSVMQTENALFRTAFELAEDAARENIRLLEMRFSPILHTKKGLNMETIMDATIEGLRAAENKYNIRTGVIVCGIRHMEPETSLQLAELTVAYKNRGAIGFDLAGAEYNYPAKHHVEAFYTIRNNNINCTVHAGEAYGPKSVHQAIHYLGAHRIGHGTHLIEDMDLMDYVNDHRIALEICLSSNLHTGSVQSLHNHPLRRFLDYGLRVTLNTDNRLFSDTTVSKEFFLAQKTFNLTEEEIKKIVMFGFKSAFMHYRERKKLLLKIADELHTSCL